MREDLEAVRVREHDVEKDRVGLALGAGAPELGVVGTALCLNAALAQGIDRELADVLVVLYVVDHVRRSHQVLPYCSSPPAWLGFSSTLCSPVTRKIAHAATRLERSPMRS